MVLVHVPRPPASAFDPNRKASALLRNQVEHMHLAERRLPERYRTKIYVNAIETEGEVAEYISQVTTAIARAHGDARRTRANSGVSRAGAVSKTSRVAKKADVEKKKRSTTQRRQTKKK